MPHAAFWVVQPCGVRQRAQGRGKFQCRTRLFPFAPTTASRSPSPAHAGEAWLRAVFSQNHAISASPADAGERSTSANHTSFYSCSWDVFPYDLFPVQLCPMGLLLGQVSKWRAQRADRGAHAARGFVSGAALTKPTKSFRGGWFQCRTRLCGWCSLCQHDFSRHADWFQCRTRLCGWCSRAGRNQPTRGNHVSMPHAALWVVQRSSETHTLHVRAEFQCRTRLCGWCSEYPLTARNRASDVSMPHAALWVVQRKMSLLLSPRLSCFNAARGFVGGAASSLSALVPLRGKRPFGKSPEI